MVGFSAMLTSSASEQHTSITIINSEGIESLQWNELFDEATQLAAALQERGIGPGSRVATLGATSRRLVATIAAVWLSGATLTVLPLPGRVRNTKTFREQTAAKLRQLEPVTICGDSSMLAEAGIDPCPMWDAIDYAGLRKQATAARSGSFNEPVADPERLALLQFTSGSTADPKAVMVPDRCLVNNIESMREGFQLDSDRIVSWLPLFHDMGLIGMLGLAMATGTELILADPGVFAVQPRRWMEWISEFAGSISCAPNFAYGLAARTFAAAGTYNLGRWRLAVNGAEPIHVPTFESFLDAAHPHGLGRQAAFCVYGLAEATLAVTFPSLGSGLRVDFVERDGLATHGIARATTREAVGARLLPFVGSALGELKLRIRTNAGELGTDREVGELEIRGPSVCPGYLNGPSLANDGWLRTGDLGYLVDGRLVICGRIKDVIIIAGRNLYPEEIESTVATVEGVRPGNVAAFGIEVSGGREAIVVAAETVRPGGERGIKDAIRSAVQSAVGVAPHEILLLRKGTLPKTSSGKLQRSACRSEYLAGELSRAQWAAQSV
jgi:fatty-acyl-CoA synthase